MKKLYVLLLVPTIMTSCLQDNMPPDIYENQDWESGVELDIWNDGTDFSSYWTTFDPKFESIPEPPVRHDIIPLEKNASFTRTQTTKTNTAKKTYSIEEKSTASSKTLKENNLLPFPADSIVLFEAYDKNQLKYAVENTLAAFDEELDGIKQKCDNVDLITYILTFKNNKATITNLNFTDTKNQQQVDVFK